MRMITYKYTDAINAQERGILCLQNIKALLFLMHFKIPPPRWRSGTPFTKGEILKSSKNYYNRIGIITPTP